MPAGELLTEGGKILLAPEMALVPMLVVHLGDVALGPQPFDCGDEALRQAGSLPLHHDLFLQVSDRFLLAGDLSLKPLRFGHRTAFLHGDLLEKRFLLACQRREHRGVDVLAVRRRLIDFHGQQRPAFLDLRFRGRARGDGAGPRRKIFATPAVGAR
jgi:hypothetical protein